MRVLFVHQNYPGQYKHIIPALASRGCEVLGLGMDERVRFPNVRFVKHAAERAAGRDTHPLARDFEIKTLRGLSAARAARQLKLEGFVPDLICGHHGWGETLFLKDVWPKAKLLTFCEFFYSASGADVDFDPEFADNDLLSAFTVRAKNAAQLLGAHAADWLITPTSWQAQQIPQNFSDRLSIIHDGVDTSKVRPDRSAFIKLGRDGLTFRPGDDVITFVNRNLEPYRGYHKLMRALPAILANAPKARVVIVGGDGVSYGAPAPGGQSYKQIFFNEVRDQLDLSRVHFVGKVSYQTYLQLLQVSAVHIYLTYPFVLSWSLIEAMAAECLIVGSATPPVQEVLRHGENGLLVDFHSQDELIDTVVYALQRRKELTSLGKQARRDVVRSYDLQKVCLPQHLALIDKLVNC